MKSMFSQNRIGSARLGAPSATNTAVASYTYANGFRFRANVAKTLSSLTVYTSENGTLANSEAPVYLCRPFLGSAYKIATVTNAAATITLNGHQLQNDERILMFGTTLPTGASARGTLYYVVNTATNTFNLSLTQGGSAITWSSTGTNVCFARVLDVGYFDFAVMTNFSTYYNCTGFTYTFTVGRLYYFLTVNHNATPGSNYITFPAISNVFETSNDMGKFNTINLTTLTQDTQSIGLNGSLNYSDGTKLECRISGVSTATIVTADATNTSARGIKFKTMPDAKIRLIAVAWKSMFTIPTATTVSKNFVCDLLDNSNNVIATSQTINNLDYATTVVGLIPFYFDTVQVLEGDTAYKLRVRVTYTSTDTTCYMNLYPVTFNLDSTGTYYLKQVWNDGTNGVMFLGSEMVANNGVITDLPSVHYPCELWLDDTDPYNSTGGSSITVGVI